MTTRRVMQPCLEQSLELSVLEGVLPDDLTGHAFIIGAAPRGQDTLFSGDGMVWRFDFGGSTVPVQSRLVRTWDWQQDHDHPGSFHTVGFVRSSTEFGYRNSANTALVPFHDSRLLVTSDAGRYWEIDPATLEVITPLGYYADWIWSGPHPVNPVVATTAHPALDPATGELWLTQLELVPESIRTLEGRYNADVYVARWDGEGRMERWRLQGVHIRMGTHQIAMTEGYLIVVDTAFQVEPKQVQDPDYSYPAESWCDIYIINRADLTSTARRSGVPSKHIRLPTSLTHITADWRNIDGRIVLYASSPGASDGSEWLRPDDLEALSGNPVRPELTGFLSSPIDLCPLCHFLIDGPSGTLLESHELVDPTMGWGVALYARNELLPGSLEMQQNLFWAAIGYNPDAVTQRVVDLYADYPTRYVPIDELPADPQPCSLFRLELASFEIADRYLFPVSVAVTSPVFVPRAGCADDLDGYVMCVVLSDASSELWLFDAADLAGGPVCRLGHAELTIPWTIHTTWMAGMGPRNSKYQIDPARDAALTQQAYKARLAQVMVGMGPR